MNLRPTAVFMTLAGIVLVYAAVKNIYPQDVIRKALGKEPLKGPIYTGQSKGDTKGASFDALPPAQNPGVPVVTV